MSLCHYVIVISHLGSPFHCQVLSRESRWVIVIQSARLGQVHVSVRYLYSINKKWARGPRWSTKWWHFRLDFKRFGKLPDKSSCLLSLFFLSTVRFSFPPRGFLFTFLFCFLNPCIRTIRVLYKLPSGHSIRPVQENLLPFALPICPIATLLGPTVLTAQGNASKKYVILYYIGMEQRINKNKLNF